MLNQIALGDGGGSMWAGSRIGANSVLLESVSEQSTVIGIPGRVIKRTDLPAGQDDGYDFII